MTVLLHIPVARKDSYRTMYQYETTPLSTDGFRHHVLVYPKETIVSVDKHSRQIRPMTKETMDKCSQVGLGPRFCPADSFEKTTPEPSCLLSLYGNRNTDIVATCPIVYVHEGRSTACSEAVAPSFFGISTSRGIWPSVLWRRVSW